MYNTYHVITSDGTSALGVKEEARTVRRDLKRPPKLESGLQTRAGLRGGGCELLDGEEERDTLPTGELHGGGGVVDAVLLFELRLKCVCVCVCVCACFILGGERERG